MIITTKTTLFLFLTLLISFSFQFEDFGILNTLRHQKQNKTVSNNTMIVLNNNTNSTNPLNASSISDDLISNYFRQNIF